MLVVLGDPRFERWCVLASRTLLSLVGVVFGASFGVCILSFAVGDGRVDSRSVSIAQASDTSCSGSLVRLPHGGAVGFEDVSSRLGGKP